ncbi:MAG: L,D-transpeptidase [Nitratireductor sp.]|nr:L,D-transpeptidase [Nitratireductor sp.]
MIKTLNTGTAALLAVMGLSLLLTGCSSTGGQQGRAAFVANFPKFDFRRHQSPTNFKAQYAALVDDGFELPRIPVEKMDERYLRQRVAYETREKPGTIIVDVSNRFLYLVEQGGTAMRYGVGVGRQGFEWSGTAYIGWKQKWPRWTPPDTMIARKPELVKYSAENGGMDPGVGNPLGARALYLFQDGKDTLYRLHGTPEWNSIGTAASSGCVRLMNQDIIDLYDRVQGSARVIVKQ